MFVVIQGRKGRSWGRGDHVHIYIYMFVVAHVWWVSQLSLFFGEKSRRGCTFSC